jgi:WD40 repeat protein
MIYPEVSEAAALPSGEPPSNPFKGLAYYETSDEGRFAGRQRDIEAVVNGILRTRTFVIYGRSGLGKTSLLLAGVFPRLKTHNCRTLDVRLLDDPVDDLRRALGRQCGLADEEAAGTDLEDLIRRFGHTPEGEDLLVVIAFDQFEEFFVRFADQPDPAGGVRSGEELDRKVRQKRIAQREDFIREVGLLAANTRLNLRLVFSLREDWVAEMGDFAAAIPEIMQSMHRLLPLTSFGVRQAVVETLRAGQVDFDSRLISALVDTLADFNFDPVVLQVLCSEVWKKARERCKDRPLRLEVEDLALEGGVRDVFRGLLENALQEIGPEPPPRKKKVLTGAVLDALISEKRTKQAMSKADLLRQHFHIDETELKEVLDRLSRNRLVRTDPRGGWYELVHERLVGAILEWFETDRDFFEFRSARILVVNSCRNRGWNENPNLLLNAGQIDGTVGPFKEILRFNDEEKLFLVSSAVYGPSKDLKFWADLAGMDAITQLLDHFFDQKDHEQLRLRAAEAAGRVKERREHFARRCFDLALQDPSEEVRRAAAASFADLAAEPDLRALSDQLHNRKENKAALAVLVEVIDKGKVAREVKFGRYSLWRAERKLYQRRLDTARKETRARARRGAFIGLKASLLWSVTTGLLISRIAALEIFSRQTLASPQAWVFWAAIYLVAALGIGALLGSGIAWRSARVALRRKREGQVFRSLAGGALPLVCGTIALVWILVSCWKMSKGIKVRDVLSDLSGLIAIGLLLVQAWLACWAALAKPALLPPQRQSSAWIWTWVWAFGGSLLPYLLGWPSLEAISRTLDSLEKEGSITALIKFYSGVETIIAPIFIAVVGGLAAYISLLSITLSAPSQDLAQARSRGGLLRQHFGKGVLVLAALGVGFLLVQSFGWDSLPYLADHRTLGQSEIAVPLRAARGPIDTHYLELEVPSSATVPGALAPRLVDVGFPTDWRGGVVGGEEIAAGTVLVTQPGERWKLAFWGGEQPGLIRLRPDQKPWSSAAPSGLGVLPLAARNSTWSGRLDALQGLRQGRSLFLSGMAQGGSWCENASISVRFAGPAGSPLDRLGFLCKPTLKEVTFSRALPWDPAWREWNLTAWMSKVLTSRRAGEMRVSADGELVATFVSADSADRLAMEVPAEDLDRYRVDFWHVDRPDDPRHLRLSEPVADVAFSPDGHWIGVASGRALRLWTTDAGSSPIALEAPGFQKMLFSPDSRRLVALINEGAAHGTSILVWDLAFPDRGLKLKMQRELSSMAISSDGAWLATGDRTGNVQIWDLSRAGRLVEASGSETTTKYRSIAPDAIVDVLFSPDKKRLATLSADGSARLWRTNDLGDPFLLRPAQPGAFETGSAEKIVFSPDSNWLLTVFDEARLWPMKGPSQTNALANLKAIVAAELSPTGDRVAVASADGIVRILPLSGSGVPVEIRHRSPVHMIRFSADGRRLATASRDGTVQIWASDGSGETIVLGNGNRLNLVDINRDGTRVVTATADGFIRVWDLSHPLDLKNAGPVYLFLSTGERLPAESSLSQFANQYAR